MIISHETRELFLRSKTFMNMMQLNQSFTPFTNANILAQTLITEHDCDVYAYVLLNLS